MILQRIRDLFRRASLDADLDAELAHHVESLEAEYRARGLSALEARRAAERDMGGLIQTKEACRDERRIPFVETTWRSVRFAARSLRRTPSVAAAVTTTLAIGIGANTAIFTVLDGVILKPLPYPDSEALVAIAHRTPSTNTDEEIPSAPYLYFAYRDETRTLQRIGLWRTGPASITGMDQPEEVQALVVTADILPALGVRPRLGREFSSRDDSPGSALTAMLTYGYWQRRFGGSTSIIGRRLIVDGQACDVIGVMPQDFRFLDRQVDIIYPFQLDSGQVTLGRYVFQSLARLKPGVTIEDATGDLARIVPLAIERFPPPAGYTRAQFAKSPIVPRVRPLKHEVVGDVGHALWVLMAAIGLVLLIACANVANLLLVRAESRQQELAIRAALGASSRRIAGELLVESVLLSVAGGGLGLAVAYGALETLRMIGPAQLPRLDEISIDGSVLLFTFVVSLAAGLVFGVLPIVKYSRPKLAAGLGASGRTSTDSRERHRTRSALVVVQVAVALLLLVCSGLMVRTLHSLSKVHPGFARPEDVQMAHITIQPAVVPDAERRTRMQQDLVDRIGATAGVTSVAFADVPPLGGNSGSDTVLIAEGKLFAPGQPRPLRRFEFISPAFFRTLGTPVIAGREFTWTDLYDRRLVAVVSENLARDDWGSAAHALGKRVRASPDDPWREIIGVVGQMHDDGMNQPAPPIVYFPALVDRFWSVPTVSFSSATFLVRTRRAGSESFLRDLQRAVWAVDPSLPLAQVRTLADAYRGSLARTSFVLTMLALAAAMGLVLGFIGVYAVIAYGVSQRTREIGIRLALGARPAEVERLFVGHGVALACVGVLAGLAAAAAVTRLMSALLFGVTAVDLPTYSLVAVLVLMIATLAAYLPARRATRGVPLDALR